MVKDTYYMQLALEEAGKALKLNEVPVGCVIVHKKRVIARAHNLKENLQTATAHAEILAINMASSKINNWRLSDCDLYVTLEPCAMCASAIVQSRLKRVIIGALDNKAGSVISSKHIFENNHNHKLIVKSGVLKNECEAIMQSFLSMTRSSIE